MIFVIGAFCTVLTAILMWLLVFLSEPSMSPVVPMVLAFVLVAVALYNKMAFHRHSWPVTVSILLFVNTAIGCKTFQDWGREIPFIPPIVMMRVFMFVCLFVTAYILFVVYKANSAFKGKWGNVEMESLILEEVSLSARWKVFLKKIRGIQNETNSENDGIIFNLGRTVKEKRH